MTDRFYPVLTPDAILAIERIARLYEGDKMYLNYPECPYAQNIKDIFQGTAMYHDFDSHALDEIPTADNILVTINKLHKELAEYGEKIKNSSDASASDQNTYFRLSVMLIEKLANLREGVSKISEVEKFYAEVISILDKVLTTEQRSIVLERLKGIIHDDSKQGDAAPEAGVSNS